MQKLRNFIFFTTLGTVCLLLWLVLAPVDHVIHVLKKYRRRAVLRNNRKLTAKEEST